jgi:hypothetical protein
MEQEIYKELVRLSSICEDAALVTVISVSGLTRENCSESKHTTEVGEYKEGKV